jgi:shikimate kinase
MSKYSSFIVGASLTGKSTVGRLLAARSGLRLIDTDDEYSSFRKVSIFDLFVNVGSEHVRRDYSQWFLEECFPNALCGHIVVIGGTLCLTAKVRDALRRCSCNKFTLEISAATSLRRLRTGGHAAHPLLSAHSSDEFCATLFELRKPLYRIGGVITDCDHLSTEQVVEIMAKSMLR